MSSKFYTNVQAVGNNILYRGIADGKRVKAKIPYQPSLFEVAKKPTEFKSLTGEYLQEIQFTKMRDARAYSRQFEGVSGKTIYGNTRFEYTYIAGQHKKMVDWDFSHVLIGIIDIEVGSENGFPDPYKAEQPVTAIALKYIGGHMFVFGCGDYEVKGKERYMKCNDEVQLLKMFLKLWSEKCPDALTGWNTKFFDVPYLVNRIRKILGDDEVVKLSPWNMIRERKTHVMNREQIVYELVGVGDLDYLELYKWYSPNGKSQESYKLDNIANVELGKKKLSYDDYDNLHDLYKRNFQLFIEYNIVDVELIEEMDDKLKLLELALTLAYDTKTNYDDVFAQTRMWDALTYNHLLNQNIIVPPKVIQEKSDAFEGAYVKEPQVGLHNWVASFDLNSLYPHLMMQYNISPETLIDPRNYTDEMRSILSQGVSVERLLNQQVDLSGLDGVTITPNGQFFRTDVQGFLPAMMVEMYEDRKKFKKMMLVEQQNYENEKDESKKYEIEKLVARYNNLQLAKKVSLNSAYGALGSQYFRFYDLRMALGVTTAGQLSIRWIEARINQWMNKMLGGEQTDYVIASDTDSIYLRMGELIDRFIKDQSDKQRVIALMDQICKDKIEPYINKSYQDLADYVHAYAQKMQMKREGLSDKGVWTAKKRYILNVYNNEGVQYAEPHMKVMGLEMIKSSTPSAIRDKMKATVQLMMTGTETEVQDFIAEFRSEFKKLPPEDISFPRGVNGIREYGNKTHIYVKGTPIHVKGALIYNNYLEEKGLKNKYPVIQDGEKIKFSYLKRPNPLKDTVISFPGRLPPEFEINQYIDYDMQFEKAYLEPIKNILDCMNWSTEKVNTLFD